MILQALCSYYRRASAEPGVELIRPGYARLGVSGELVIDRQGNLVAANPLYTLEGKKKSPLMMTVPLPPKRSGQRPEAAFLYETVAFLFGIYEKADGAAYRFEASRAAHEAVLSGCTDEGAQALLTFFEKRVPGSVSYKGVDTSLLNDERTFVVFRLQGDSIFLHQRPAVMQAWERCQAQKTQDAQMGQCLVTGEIAPIARLHGNVSGFGADKPTLIGFNQDSFCSFGKYGQQGANAPVSEQAAFEYVTALNLLCRDPRHAVNLAGDKLLFWAEREAISEEELMGACFGGSIEKRLDEEQANRILKMLDSLYKGGSPQDCHLDPDVRFYILGLSSNKTRLVVRFFHESTFGDLLDNILAHYHGLEVEGARYRFPAPYYLLLETAVQHTRENVPPTLESALMRSILTGAAYPQSLMQAVLRRVRAEGEISALRAGILKASINRQSGKEVIKMSLDTNERDPAYLLGRLFALFERAQYVALGDLNATITDKYLNSALATPQMVFPTLMTLSEKHLVKSDTPEKRSRLHYLRIQIGGVVDLLELRTNSQGKYVFPTSLDTNDQGKFLVGYYHQMQFFYRKRDHEEVPNRSENDE